ncbi:MAG: putative NEK protein kinase [Streblomastix strix]|uniref:non-specific serine/threonine protein kinase n=1 Tax=Streblomastix strix TaxID=222440 RepID=A0A5J4UF88_9EUKA|nr:MAG: putative NEK protein kinase [Streblomastix strix]
MVQILLPEIVTQNFISTWKKSDFIQKQKLGQGGFGIVRLVQEIITQKFMAWKQLNYEEKREKDLVDSEVNILLQDVWKFIAQIVFSLNQLHSNRIIHGDLKPGNVLLTNDNQIKLADFGLAQKLRESRDFITAHGGTLQYFPPEMMQGKVIETNDMSRNPPPYDNVVYISEQKLQKRKAVDVWACGVLIYELIMLQHPFIRNEEVQQFNLAAFIDRLRNENPQDLSTHFSENLKNLVKAMLEKDPTRRITTEQILLIPEVAQRLGGN